MMSKTFPSLAAAGIEAAAFRENWFPICRAADLGRRPLARTVLGHPLVLARINGRVAVMEDRCPHRNAPLSAGRVTKDGLRCPYHGWAFDADGRCTSLPGLADPKDAGRRGAPCAQNKPAQERDGLIWVYMGEATPEKPPYRPDMGDAAKVYDFSWVVSGRGALTDLAENFLDSTHTHFVHAGLLRVDKYRRPVSVKVRGDEDRVTAEYSGEKRQAGLLPALLEGQRANGLARFVWPNITELEYRDDKGARFIISAFLTPGQDDHFHIPVRFLMRSGGLSGRLLRLLGTPLFYLALRQDQNIVELQRSNIRRFGGPRYLSTELDIIRPYIRKLLQDGPGPGCVTEEKTFEMLI